jgi:hypothetical protein
MCNYLIVLKPPVKEYGGKLFDSFMGSGDRNLTQKVRKILSRELRNTLNDFDVDCLKCCTMQRECPLIFYLDIVINFHMSMSGIFYTTLVST